MKFPMMPLMDCEAEPPHRSVAAPAPVEDSGRTHQHGHKPRCPVNGGFGHGPEPCICGVEDSGRSAPEGWQPIETAPLGDLVLVHDDGYVGKGLLQDDGRWLDVECGRDDAFFEPPPQHWMKIPAPPRAALLVPQEEPKPKGEGR